MTHDLTEMDAFLKEFGLTLKTTRKQMGLSQVTAAQNMKIDYRHYQNIEGGKINLRLDTLMKLVKFYNLVNKNDAPFNFDAFLQLINGSSSGSDHHNNWDALYDHFVQGGHAGYLVVRCDGKTVVKANERLFGSLGVGSQRDLVSQHLAQLINDEGLRRVEDFCRGYQPDEVSSPFIVSFKTQPPAYPIPMMAVLKVKKENSNGEDLLHCIFFDRKTLEEEGHRLADILSGYKQFMELYPQLKAV